MVPPERQRQASARHVLGPLRIALLGLAWGGRSRRQTAVAVGRTAGPAYRFRVPETAAAGVSRGVACAWQRGCRGGVCPTASAHQSGGSGGRRAELSLRMSRRAAGRALGVTEIEHLGSKRDRPARGDESAGSKDPDGLVTPHLREDEPSVARHPPRNSKTCGQPRRGRARVCKHLAEGGDGP
jgi:hypothetical protein